MKNLNISIIKRSAFILAIFLCVVCMLSCKKWLDVRPGGQIKQEDLFKTEEGFDRAISGVYIQMQDNLYKDNLSLGMLSTMSQCYERVNNSYLYDAVNYNYNSTELLPTINLIWGSSYGAIGNLNNILDNIDKYKSVFYGNHYEIIKGQALGLRAFLHFDLLRLFGKTPVNNLNTPSVPYITTFGKNVTPLSTIDQIAKACLKDLDEAEQLLSINKNFYKGNGSVSGADFFNEYTQNRMNYWAVKALKARIYLYINNKEMAYKNAIDVIQNSTLALITDSQVGNTSASDNIFSKEFLFAIKASLLQDFLRDRFFFNPATNIGGDAWRLQYLYNTTFNINNIFEVTNGGSTDFRYLYHFRQTGDYSICYKYPSASNGLEINQIPLIRLSEMYFIASETSISLSEGVQYFNQIREHRGLTALSIEDNETLKIEIAKEYQKEFYAEGQLFYYYKRLGQLGIPRAKNDMTIADFTLPLPQDEIDLRR